MRPYGKINLVGLLFIAALAGGIWWLINFAPAYLDNLDVNEAVTAAINQARNRANDDAIRNHIIFEASKVGSHKTTDEFGNEVWREGLGITAEDIEIFRDEVHNSIVINVEYDRHLKLWPTGREAVVRLTASKQHELK